MNPLKACEACELCETGFVRHRLQPHGGEFALGDDIFVKQMMLDEAGMLVPQHAHRYDHTSMLAVGRIHAWADQQDLGEFKAPAAIFIKKGVKHTFLSLEDNVVIYCIHNVSRSGEIEIAEEHQLVSHEEK